MWLSHAMVVKPRVVRGGARGEGGGGARGEILVRKKMTRASFDLYLQTSKCVLSYHAHLTQSGLSWLDYFSPTDHFIIINVSSLHWSVFVSTCLCAGVCTSLWALLTPCVSVAVRSLSMKCLDRSWRWRCLTKTMTRMTSWGGTFHCIHVWSPSEPCF